jgi:bla regulator protein blaR1
MIESTLQFIDAMGWTLLHSLWQGGLIALTLWLALAVLRDASAATRYGLVSSAFLIFALCPLVTFLMVYEAPIVASTASDLVVSLQGMTAVSSVEQAATSDALSVLERFLPLMVLIWTLGVILRAARVVAEWRRASAYLAAGARAPDHDLGGRFERLVAQVAPDLTPILMISDRVSVPAVVGWLRPVVLLPTAVIAGLSPVQLELILAHELAHIRRHDYLINLCQIVMETLLFYHPAVHWMSKLMRDLREECCDEIVIAQRGERVAYARALADLEGLRQHDGMVCMAATGGQLFDRIMRIALPHQHRGHAPWSTGLIISATAAIVVTTGGQLLSRANPISANVVEEARQVTERYAPIAAPSAAAVGSVAPLTLPRAEDQSVAIASSGPVIDVTWSPLQSAPLALDLDAMDDDLLAMAPASLPARPSTTLVTGGDSLVKVTPVFPRSMRRDGRGALVEFEFTVLEDGRIADIQFLGDAEEDEQFRAAVLEAVEGWRFEPFVVDGQPVSQRLRDSVQFEVTAATDNGACSRITGSRVCRSARSRAEEYGVSVVYRGTN